MESGTRDIDCCLVKFRTKVISGFLMFLTDTVVREHGFDSPKHAQIPLSSLEPLEPPCAYVWLLNLQHFLIDFTKSNVLGTNVVGEQPRSRTLSETGMNIF